MKRRDDETFKEYKERRKLIGLITKGYNKGRLILQGKIFDPLTGSKAARIQIPYTKKLGEIPHSELTGKLTALYDLSLSELKKVIGIKEVNA